MSLPPARRPLGRPKAQKPPALGRPPGKFTQHRKLSRLHDLLEKHPQGLTIPEIASALRLTSRSVRRYLTYLKDREASDALESIPFGPRGALRWRMNPKDRGRAMNLRRTQAYGLLAVRTAFEALQGSALYEEIEIVTQQMIQLARRPVRAGGGADIASDTRMEERFVLCHERVPSQTRGGELDDVFRAVADLRVLALRYLPLPSAARATPEGRGEKMSVHPYALVVYRGAAHCIARDTVSGSVDVLPVSRMRETEPSDARFELPEDFRVDDYVHGPFGLGRALHPIVVEFTPPIADSFRTHKVHPRQRVAMSADGRARLSVTVPSLEEAQAWVLGFGALARVVEPPELRDAVVRELKSAVLRYGR